MVEGTDDYVSVFSSLMQAVDENACVGTIHRLFSLSELQGGMMGYITSFMSLNPGVEITVRQRKSFEPKLLPPFDQPGDL